MDWLLLFLWMLLSSGAAGFFAVTNCCCGCNYFVNAGSDTIANYDVISGAWSVALSEPSTSSSNALILFPTASVSNFGTVAAEPSLLVAGDVLKLVAGYLDTDNYIFAEVTQTATDKEVRLYKRIAGVNTQLGDTMTISGTGPGIAGTQPAVTLCVGPYNTYVHADFMALEYQISHNYSYSIGSRAGLGTGTITGGAQFDEIAYVKHSTDDATCTPCDCQCSCCRAGTLPESYEFIWVAPARSVILDSIRPVVGALSQCHYAGLDGTDLIIASVPSCTSTTTAIISVFTYDVLTAACFKQLSLAGAVNDIDCAAILSGTFPASGSCNHDLEDFTIQAIP